MYVFKVVEKIKDQNMVGITGISLTTHLSHRSSTEQLFYLQSATKGD